MRFHYMGLWALWLITQYKIQAFTGLISLEDIISLCIIKFHSQLSNYEFFFSVLCFFGILLVLQFFGHQLFKTIRVCLDSIQHLEFCVFNVFSGSRALFIRPASTFFHKNNFKTGSHSTIHTFKNYFATLFSVFSNKRYPNRPLVTSKK